MQKHLNAALGYLGLGMAMDAWNELEEIDAKDRGKPDVLKVRVEVARALGKWELMAELSNHLRKVEPDEVGHSLNMAYAVRRFKSEAEAADILSLALRRYFMSGKRWSVSVLIFQLLALPIIVIGTFCAVARVVLPMFTKAGAILS